MENEDRQKKQRELRLRLNELEVERHKIDLQIRDVRLMMYNLFRE